MKAFFYVFNPMAPNANKSGLWLITAIGAQPYIVLGEPKLRVELVNTFTRTEEPIAELEINDELQKDIFGSDHISGFLKKLSPETMRIVSMPVIVEKRPMDKAALAEETVTFKSGENDEGIWLIDCFRRVRLLKEDVAKNAGISRDLELIKVTAPKCVIEALKALGCEAA